MQSLRICLEGRHVGCKAGGIEQVAFGLASGLSKLTDGNEEYYFLIDPEAEPLMAPYVHEPCRFLYSPPSVRSKWKQVISDAFPRATSVWHELNWRFGRQPVTIPTSDGTVEKANIDIMHFIWQGAFLTNIPNIYHPYDLQHLHFPEYFGARQCAVREMTYRAYCESADMVSAHSSFIKEDLIKQYRLPEDKVQIIPLAPMLTAYPDPDRDDFGMVRTKFSLPDSFIFYPAQTWPHKNHLKLLEALAILRDNHRLEIKLVCSGHQTDFFTEIERRVRQLNLDDQVLFLGFVSPLELQCLYELCRLVVIPTKFESWSFPVWEAFLAGAPVACSKVSGLPLLTGEAAVHFDPENQDEMAAAIRYLWNDQRLREDFAARGKERVAKFSWDRTARIFRAHYRRLAGRRLNAEDQELISTEPLV